MCALPLFALMLAVGPSPADPPAPAGPETPARVRELEAEVRALKKQVAALELALKRADPVYQSDLVRRFGEARARLKEKPGDAGALTAAREAATELARLPTASHVGWQPLLDTGLLKDGMTPAEAEALLGPPTERRPGRVGWYHNPGHRMHVAPYLSAAEADGRLTGWVLNRR